VAVFVSARGISPLYAGVAIAVAASLGTSSQLRTLLARRDLRRWIFVSAVCAGITGAWVLLMGVTHNDPRKAHTLGTSLNSSVGWLRQAVGDSIDLRISLPVAVSVYGAISVLIVVHGFRGGHARGRVALASICVVALGLPITSDAFNLPPAGVGWQGRYGLPLLVGAVLVAGHVGRVDVSRATWRLGLALMTCVQVAFYAAFAEHWVSSPVVTATLIALNVIAAGLTALLLDRAIDRPLDGAQRDVRRPRNLAEHGSG
jgi:hypothetical protein